MRIINTQFDGLNAALDAVKSQVSDTDNFKLQETVKGIIADVKIRGDEALIELGRKFDSPELSAIKVTAEEFDEAYKLVDAELIEAIRKAKENIERFHKLQMKDSWTDVRENITYGQIIRPIEKVGFYAPGGLAPYPSTVLMAAIPGVVAGVSQLVMCAPAQKNGKIHPAMLVAANECGVREVYKVGGAQAVAAMAFGTETVVRVDKIVGPGNAFVAEAKRQVFGIVGIDQMAGPSEILIIADETANAKFTAADLLSQAEHAEDSRCVFVTNNQELLDNVILELENQIKTALRADFITKSMQQALLIKVENMKEAVKVSNEFAPEHLEIMVREPWEMLKSIKNAGTIMLGHYTPVPACDFAAGPNHTLPTNGTARFSSALSVDDYIKKSGLLSISKEGIKELSKTIIKLAETEGFEAHANTINIRIKN
jgi:histidinol dehydrogenase